MVIIIVHWLIKSGIRQEDRIFKPKEKNDHRAQRRALVRHHSQLVTATRLRADLSALFSIQPPL
jgi:hypothetical protein